MSTYPFHLAFPVADLGSTRAFYHELLACPIGRESETWIDFDFFGNQITAHLEQSYAGGQVCNNEVDTKQVPVPHFGAIVPWDVFPRLARKLEDAEVPFIHAPMIRFAGEIGEQATLFVRDPSGNAIEFKSFKDEAMVFRKGT